MPHCLVTGILPDNFDPPTQDEATVHNINMLNDELEAAAARLVLIGYHAGGRERFASPAIGAYSVGLCHYL